MSQSIPTGIISTTPSSGTKQPLATAITASTDTIKRTNSNQLNYWWGATAIANCHHCSPGSGDQHSRIVVIVVARMQNKKRKDQVSSAHYEDVQDSTGIEMKENEAYIRHSAIRVEETSPSASSQPEYEYVDHVHVTGNQLQQGEIEIKRNKAYAQVVTTLND